MISATLLLAAGAFIASIAARRIPSLGVVWATGLALAVIAGWVSGMVLHSRIALWVLLSFVAGAFPLLIVLRPAARAAWRAALRFRIGTGRDRLPTLLLMGGLAAMTLLLAKAVGIPLLNYDVLSYHLPQAEAMTRADGGAALFQSPDSFYARMAMGGPILESLFMNPGNPGRFGFGIQAFIALSIVAGACSAARCAAWLGGRRIARLCAGWLYLAHPLLGGAMDNALFDPVIALLAIASLELLLQGESLRGRRWQLLLAGALAGTAVATKFSAVGTALIPLGIVSSSCLIGRLLARGGLPALLCLRSTALFALGAFAVLAPWFLRGILLGGHPLFPFMGESAGWSHAQAEFVVSVHQPLSPFSLEYWRQFLTRTGMLGFPIPFIPFSGASILLLAAGCSFFPRGSRLGRLIVLAALVGYASWLTLRQNPARFLAPAAVLLIPVAATAAMRWRRGAVVNSFAALVLLLATLSDAMPRYVRWGLGEPVYRAPYREAMLDELGAGFLAVARAARDAAPADGELLLLFEARPAIFARTPVWNTVWDVPPWAPLLRESGDATDFSARLRKAGMRAIFVNEFEWSRFLQFYARDRFPKGESLMGRVGLSAPGGDEAALASLRAFPPFRFASLSDRELTILLQFLHTHRARAAAATPAGPHSEIWYAYLDQE